MRRVAPKIGDGAVVAGVDILDREAASVVIIEPHP
jgi:hypothetical protein